MTIAPHKTDTASRSKFWNTRSVQDRAAIPTVSFDFAKVARLMFYAIKRFIWRNY